MVSKLVRKRQQRKLNYARRKISISSPQERQSKLDRIVSNRNYYLKNRSPLLRHRILAYNLNQSSKRRLKFPKCNNSPKKKVKVRKAKSENCNLVKASKKARINSFSSPPKKRKSSFKPLNTSIDKLCLPKYQVPSSKIIQIQSKRRKGTVFSKSQAQSRSLSDNLKTHNAKLPSNSFRDPGLRKYECHPILQRYRRVLPRTLRSLHNRRCSVRSSVSNFKSGKKLSYVGRRPPRNLIPAKCGSTRDGSRKKPVSEVLLMVTKDRKKKPAVKKLSIFSNLLPRRNVFKLAKSVPQLVRNLARHCKGSKPAATIEAKTLVKWCVLARRRNIHDFQRKYTSLKVKCRTYVDLFRTSSTFKEKREVTLGASQHTSNTEFFYSETSYKCFDHRSIPLAINEIGCIVNVFRGFRKSKKGSYSWQCSSLCNVDEDDSTKTVHRIFRRISNLKSVTQMVSFLRDMDNCKSACCHSGKQGHSLSCRNNNGNGAPLVILQNLMPHYPQLRAIVRILYELKRVLHKISMIGTALHKADLSKLKQCAEETKISGGVFRVGSFIYECEDAIVAKHKSSFKALTKKMNDLPTEYCFSCERLCYARDLTEIARMKKKPDNKTWEELQQYAEAQKLSVRYVCHFCLTKIRSNQLPAVASLNNLQVGSVPPVIKNLNNFERIFIQRAKAFQVVTRMGTVSKKKNMPASHKIPKVVGRTFHLPLPIEETMKKVLEPHEAVLPNQEFFILVRGLPSKQKTVWQSLINVSNVYEALRWLKSNNPLYAQIELPRSAEDLLSFLDDFEVQEPSLSVESEENVKELHSTPRAPMLTQKNEGDQFYDQLTVYPVAEKRENKSGSELYQMRRVAGNPLDSREKNLDLLCFPDLYPKGVNGHNESRRTHLPFADFVKARMLSRYALFRMSIQYIFFLLNLVNMRQLSAGIYQTLNTSREKLSKRDLLRKLAEGKLEGNLTNIYSRLRNTEQYWKTPRSEIFCMIDNYGPPTFFLTLSPADYDDLDLGDYLRRVNPDSKGKSLSALIASDPISVSRYYDQLFKGMLDFVTSPKDAPLGIVEHYAWRREYQGRGTQHFHMLLWIKDAPILVVSSDEEVAAFIQKTITCCIPNKKNFPELYAKVLRYQIHYHNSYCLRTKRMTRGFKRACRFSFPRVVTQKLILHSVASSIAGRRNLTSKSRLYDLPRKETERCVNDYNAALLMAWTGNIDLQFVGESSAIIAKYITKYQTKPEKSHMVDIFNDVNSTKSLQSRLWNVALRGLSNRECGALEAADTLLGIPLFGTDKDTVIRWIDVRLFRNRRMKTLKQLETLDSEDTDLFCPSLVDTHYPNRPTELEKLSLYDFARNYDIIKEKPKRADTTYYPYPGNDSLYFRLRNKNPYLIRHFQFDPKQKPEDYFFSMLLLFKSWRKLEDIRGDHSTFVEAFNAAKDSLAEAMKYHKKLRDIQAAREAMEKLIEEKTAENQIENEEDDDAMLFQANEAAGAMEEFRANLIEEESDLDLLESQLNADQHRVYSYVQSAIKSGTPLRHFVSGVGGTGKSFLIKVIKLWVRKILQKDVAVTAPTGIAAFNVNGLTIHRLLQLPIEHGKDVKYAPLSDHVLQVLRLEMKNVGLVIIDEISMVSNITLRFIHLRLSEIFDTTDVNDGWFGKINLLVFGDLLQLPPVQANSPFIDLDQSENVKYFATLSNVNLWRNNFTFDELQINMRQRDDKVFSHILANIRLGFCSTENLSTLQSRQIQFNSDTADGRLKELSEFVLKCPDEPVCLLPTRKMCSALNKTILSLLPGEVITLKAVDSTDCKNKQDKKNAEKKLDKFEDDCSRTAGLEKEIKIKVGARVMLKRNIDVTQGYVNGATGTVLSVIYDINKAPKSLKIQMKEDILNLTPTTSKFEILPSIFNHRKQYPITVAYGMTIHKSQGLSLKSCIVDIGNSVFTCGQSYVALSRVTSLQGLHLINFDPHNIMAQRMAIEEYNRLRSKFAPHLKNLTTSDIRRHKPVPDKEWTVRESKAFDEELENSESTLLPVFSNEDSVSCYANATCQCLLSYAPLTTALKNSIDNNALKQLALKFTTVSSPLSTKEIRSYAGHQFNEHQQQDAPEFLGALIEANEIARQFTRINFLQETRCTNCNALVRVEETRDHMIQVPTTASTKNINELLKHYSSWSEVKGSRCTNCPHGTHQTRNIIQETSDLLVIQLNLWTPTKVNNEAVYKKNNTFKLNALPTTKCQINQSRYQLHAAVFHHGLQADSGHYTAIVRKGNKFISANDLLVKECKWPLGSRGVYMLFYKRFT